MENMDQEMSQSIGNKHPLHQHSAQSMVEFALILPLLALIIAGIFDLGRAFYASIAITNAARVGARYGTLYPDYYDAAHPEYFYWIKKATKDATLGSMINLYSTDAVITVVCPDTDLNVSCDHGQPITVSILYNYDDMIFQFFFPNGINMLREIEMQVP